MPLVHGLGQRIGNGGARPDHRRFVDSELHRDRVGGFEADAADVTREGVDLPLMLMKLGLRIMPDELADY